MKPASPNGENAARQDLTEADLGATVEEVSANGQRVQIQETERAEAEPEAATAPGFVWRDRAWRDNFGMPTK